MKEIDHMSWRRFLVLIHNLNPHGAVAYRYEAERKSIQEEREKENQSSQRAADDFFSALLSM